MSSKNLQPASKALTNAARSERATQMMMKVCTGVERLELNQSHRHIFEQRSDLLGYNGQAVPPTMKDGFSQPGETGILSKSAEALRAHIKQIGVGVAALTAAFLLYQVASTASTGSSDSDSHLDDQATQIFEAISPANPDHFKAYLDEYFAALPYFAKACENPAQQRRIDDAVQRMRGDASLARCDFVTQFYNRDIVINDENREQVAAAFNSALGQSYLVFSNLKDELDFNYESSVEAYYEAYYANDR